MRTGSEGFQQCYNAQVAVDSEHRLIVAMEPASNANDQRALVGLPDEVRDRFDAQPATVLADAGYCNGRDLSELEARGIDGYVARGQVVGGQGRGEAPCNARHGRETDHARRPGAVRATQMAIRGAQRPDQGGPRLPAVQYAGSGEGAGECDLVCLAPDIRRCNRFRQCECARPPAGWGRNHPYRKARRNFPTLPYPCPPLRTSDVPAPVPASGPACPSAHVPELPFHGAGS